MTPDQLKQRLPNLAFAFRGYNVTNQGRSAELLENPVYAPIVQACLQRAGNVCAEMTSKTVDLVARVRNREATTLDTYAEDIAMIMAMEDAQLKILDKCFGIEARSAKTCFGYSLGEISAVAAAGVFDCYESMRVPLALSADCAQLAAGVTLAVLFSRGVVLPMDLLTRLCLEINQAGQGVIGVSALLSPNSILLMGQGDTLDRLQARLGEGDGKKLHLRKHSAVFPPLHTPIMWERSIPNRAGVIMHTIKAGFGLPVPTVLSLVTGKASYDAFNAREHMQRWIDHPQRLWDVVYETLKMKIETVVHVGPEPNIVPATYSRLRDNVETETRGSIRKRALSAVVQHPWIRPMLGQRTTLLQALRIEQFNLEDWLLEQQVA